MRSAICPRNAAIAPQFRLSLLKNMPRYLT